ncbi:PAS domain S-box-containing protein [Mucilaginibacter pineti]|uniref:histidine kinase n=1 Tax=Mucilaginibacter pineti TaxID=1391627 RepID=A0A1G7FT41_9SPHI|nr:PAS domain S-box protein [Mucilaginibacter pineti]SDE79077.1 PAS domain S-box-containing protein [Mucilaginibacter pineti]
MLAVHNAVTDSCVLIYDVDDQQYLFISPCIYAIAGIHPHELAADNNFWYKLINNKQADSIYERINNMQPNGNIELSYQITTPQNTVKNIADNRSLAVDATSGHKILQSIIRESPDENPVIADDIDFSTLFYNNISPMYLFDLDTLRILKVNKAAIATYGYSLQEFLSMTVLDMRPQGEHEKVNEYIQQNSFNKSNNKIFTSAGLWKHHNKNGDIIYAEITGHDIHYNNLNCRMVTATDVTEKVKFQEEAKVREQLLNSLIDSQTNFLIRVNNTGHFSFVNRQFLKTLGYNINELLGQHFSITSIPQELHLCEAAFASCMQNPGKVITLQHKKPDVQGNLHDIDWEFISVVDEQGQVVEIQGIGQDITRKLIIEKEIKNTSQKLDAFIESITDSFFIIDNNWRFMRVNAAFEKVSNCSRDEMLGQVLWDVFPSILNSGFGRAYYEAVEKHESVKFTEYFEPLKMWFRTSVYPSAEGTTFFVKDITHEKQAQEQALWTKNSLEALINNTHDQIWSVDKELRFVYLNDAYVKQISHITGTEPKAGDYSYKHPGYNQGIHDDWNGYYQRALKGEQYTITSESRDLKTKALLFFEVSFNPIYTLNGEIIGVGCFSRDVTRLLKTEQELIDQNERLRNIATLSSHEIRRPVASMMGLISIMDRDNFFNPENEEIIEHLLTVSTEIDDVIRLIVDNTFTGKN